jgi:hypothetical protein
MMLPALDRGCHPPLLQVCFRLGARRRCVLLCVVSTLWRPRAEEIQNLGGESSFATLSP